MLREVFAQTGANSSVLETGGEDMQNREHSCFSPLRTQPKTAGSLSVSFAIYTAMTK